MTEAIGTRRTQSLDTIIDKTERNTPAAIRDSASAKSAGGSSTDAAKVSDTGNLLLKAAAAADTSDVRAGKVAAIKTAIDNGSYKVPASAVADKLIQNLLG